MKNKTRILVLGADGFIGSSIIRSFVEKGEYLVRAFDYFKDGKIKNLQNIVKKIEIFPGDFQSKDDVARALKGIDYVFHFLSSTTPGSSMNNPIIDMNTNVFGMLSLLEECKKSKIKKIIFASSGGTIYGDQGKNKYKETDNTNPISPYGISKLTIEKYLEYYKKNYNLDYLVLRYANLYGQYQNISGTQGIISIFLNRIKNDEPIQIFGDGKQIRDYLYIDDAIKMTLLLFDKKTKYNLYNIGSGKGVSTIDVVKKIEKMIHKRANVYWLPERKIDVKKIILDITRFNKECSYMPKININEGIKKTWEWIVEI
jgi:UDP-glucose 4-epimerase